MKQCIPVDLLQYIDPDALKVINRLQQHGYAAYLVGGCIRDMLLQKKPKDFDVVTSAKPNEIEHLFRNSRIIGRRFQLHHIYFPNRKIIEVSTFRSTRRDPDNIQGEMLIQRQNVFGTEEEDALSRDFSVNALYYDIKSKEIIDYVNGYEDCKNNLLRTIGDTYIRFREDPVRMLRALRFKSALGMDVDIAIEQNMNILHNDIALCSTARLLEEILKILRKGNALRGFQEMVHYQFCNKLIPQLQHFYSEMHSEYLPLLERCLYAADTLFLEGKKVYDMPLICCLFYPVYLFYLNEAEKKGGNLDRGELASFILYHYAGYLHLTKRMTEKLKQILILLHYFSEKFTGKNRKGKRNDPLRIASRTFFKESLNFYQILCTAQLGDDRVYRYWKSFYFKVAASNDSLHDDTIEQLTG